MRHDDLIGLLEELRTTVAELRNAGPALLQMAREDRDAPGYPRSLRLAPGSRSTSEDSPTERYALASLDAGPRHNEMGEAAAAMCVHLNDARRALWWARGLARRAVPAAPPANKTDKALCIVCEEPAPRPRRGMGEDCYKAWTRAGRPDIQAFILERRAMQGGWDDDRHLSTAPKAA